MNIAVSSRPGRSEEHTSELQSRQYLVCRLLLEKKKKHDAAQAGGAGQILAVTPEHNAGVVVHGVVHVRGRDIGELAPLAALVCIIFFFNDTATTEIYTLSLHDALPICRTSRRCRVKRSRFRTPWVCSTRRDRKSTRLNSSHANISYAVFCLKKKKKKQEHFYTNTKKKKK